MIIGGQKFFWKRYVGSVLTKHKLLDKGQHYYAKELTFEYHFSHCVIPRAQWWTLNNMDFDLDSGFKESSENCASD